MERPVAPVPGRCGMTPNPSNPTQTEDWVMVKRSWLAANHIVPPDLASLSPRGRGPVDMLVDGDWLRRKVETDPDIDTEAGPSLAAPRGRGEGLEWLERIHNALMTPSMPRQSIGEMAAAGIAALSSAPVSGGGGPPEHDPLHAINWLLDGNALSYGEWEAFLHHWRMGDLSAFPDYVEWVAALPPIPSSLKGSDVGEVGE